MSANASLTLKRRLEASPPGSIRPGPKMMIHGWSPAEFETLVTEADARVGGRFRVLMRGTLLTLTHDQLVGDATRDSRTDGWSGALDKLERLVA